MRAWWRSVLVVCLALVAFCLHPRQADSGGMTVDLDRVTWTETDADGNTATRTGVKAGLNIVVLFVSPSPSGVPFPPTLMDKYRPIFERTAEILYDATEGDVYIKNIEFTNSVDRANVADVVFRAYLDVSTRRAKAKPLGWLAKTKGSSVELVLEQHICDQDSEAETFDALRAAFLELGQGCNTTDPVKQAECQVGQFLADLCGCGHRAPFGIAHELGHYIFGLKDEYSGELWNNCNTAVEAACGKCPLVESCDNDPDPEKCKRENLRTVVPTLGERTFSLAPGATADTALTTVQLLRPARDLVITVDLDRRTYTNAADASAAVKFVLRKPGGNAVNGGTGGETRIAPTPTPPARDAAGNRIPACQRQTVTITNADGSTAELAQTFLFTDTGAQQIWTITNPGGGQWVAEVSSTGDQNQTLKFAYRVNYKCSFRCAARTTDQNGNCASTPTVAHEACVMDGGTTSADRNTRTEYCTAHGGDASTGHDAGNQENDLSDGCKVVSFVNSQELVVGRSCWWTIANSRFRRERILKETFFERNKPLTDERIRELIASGRLVLSNGEQAGAEIAAILQERTTTRRQVLPQELRPTFTPFGRTTNAQALSLPNAMVAPDVEYVTGVPGIVFCLDTSSSMGDPADAEDTESPRKIDLALQAIRDSVNTLRDAERFGVLRFSDDIAEVQAIGTGLDNRTSFLEDLAADADAMFPLGIKTRLGDCLALVATGPLKDFTGEQMSTKAVIVISDGKNSEGSSVESQIAALTAIPRLQVHTIGVGDEADIEGLEELARLTGGNFWFADNASELGSIVPRALAVIRGEDEVFTGAFSVGAGATEVTTVGLYPFLESATFVLSSEAAEDLVFTLENTVTGETYALADDDPTSGVEFRSEQTQQFLRLDDPPGGDWRLSVRAPTGGAPYRLTVLSGGSQLSIGTRIESEGCLPYPNPIIVETIVSAPTRVTDLDVRMVVTYPGPDRIKSREILMRDDGSEESGDEEAGDGVYTAVFNEFMSRDGNGNGGDGVYVVNVVAENIVTPTTSAAQVPADDGEALQPAIPVRVPFSILDEACTIVCGLPETMEDGYAILEPVDPMLPRKRTVQELEVTPVFGFRLRPRREWLLVENLTLQLEVPKIEPAIGVDLIEMVGLYLDSDQDGEPDNRLNPLAWSRFQEVEETPLARRYEVVFDLGSEPESGRRRFIELMQTGQAHQFLVTLGQPRPRGLTYESTARLTKPEGAQVVPLPGGQPTTPPVVLVLLGALSFAMLVLTHRLHAPRMARHVTTAGFVALLFLLFLTVGCGGGGGGGGGGGTGPDTTGGPVFPPPAFTGPYRHRPRDAIAGVYDFRITPADITLRSTRGDMSDAAALSRQVIGGEVRSVVLLENR